MPKSVVKLKRFAVRVNGVLMRKSFASVSEGRAWQRSQKAIQDEIRAGIRHHLEPTLLAIGFADFLRARDHMASFEHQSIWAAKYILLRPDFRDKFVHELTRSDWKKIFGPKGSLIMAHGLSPGTHNRIRAMVHKFYEDARKDYEPPRALLNPISDIDELPEPKKKPQILATKDQIRDYILSAYQDETLASWGIYVAIKLNTGLRQQNIIPLRWRDWLSEQNVLHIREKYTRKGMKSGSKADEDERLSGVNSSLARALEVWRKATPHGGQDDFIVSNCSGGHISVHQIWDANKRTLMRAGLPYMSEHKLRHSYATHYLAAGGSVHDLKTNLFHSTITTTEIYLQSLPSRSAERASVFQAPVPNLTKKN